MGVLITQSSRPNMFKHQVLIPWERAEAALGWCLDNIEHQLWNHAYRVPENQPMEYLFSFSNISDCVRFQLTWL